MGLQLYLKISSSLDAAHTSSGSSWGTAGCIALERCRAEWIQFTFTRGKSECDGLAGIINKNDNGTKG